MPTRPTSAPIKPAPATTRPRLCAAASRMTGTWLTSSRTNCALCSTIPCSSSERSCAPSSASSSPLTGRTTVPRNRSTTGIGARGGRWDSGGSAEGSCSPVMSSLVRSTCSLARTACSSSCASSSSSTGWSLSIAGRGSLDADGPIAFRGALAAHNQASTPLSPNPITASEMDRAAGTACLRWDSGGSKPPSSAKATTRYVTLQARASHTDACDDQRSAVARTTRGTKARTGPVVPKAPNRTNSMTLSTVSKTATAGCKAPCREKT